MRKLNLRLFDGAPAPAIGVAEGSNGGASTLKPQANGSETQSKSKVVYGLASEPDTTNDPIDGKGETDNKQRLDSYKEFKKQNADLIQKDIDAVINKKFKEKKGLEEKLEALNPLLNMLGNKYNLKSNNIQGIVDAFINDDSQYSELAEAEGLTLEQAKKMSELERFRQTQLEAQNRQNANATYENWMQQAETLQDLYPDFDISEESQNPDFVKVLQNGFTVQQAYELIHPEVLTERIKKDVTSVMASNIESRQKRPTENGINASKGVDRRVNVKSFTKEDRKNAIKQSQIYGSGSVRFSS